MKEFFALLLMISLIVGYANILAHADTASVDPQVATYRAQMGDKAAAGSKNILYGWTEIPKRIVDITKESKNPFWGLFAGTFQGTLKAMARTASGITDVATAGVAPEKGSMMSPDINVE